MYSVLNTDVCQDAIDQIDELESLNAAVEAARVASGPHLPIRLSTQREINWAVVRPIVLLVVMVFCIAWGYWFGRASVQSANDLIAAGFVIADPEGYGVEHFDDGAVALVELLTTEEENPFLAADER